MRAAGAGGTIAVLGTILTLLAPSDAHASHSRASHTAAAHTRHARIAPTRHYGAHATHNVATRHKVSHAHRSRVASGLQCVPFAREESGVELIGDARTWWDQAAGVYERGNRPEVGSVLTFRAVRSMPLGHVAVVTAVKGPREVEIDHANWPVPGSRHGAISRNISVVDVSENNDWTAVRVELSQDGTYGSIYPTYGFIYDRADRGTLLAAKDSDAAVPDLNPAPRDLRVRHSTAPVEEVAELPEPPQPRHHAAYRHYAKRHVHTHTRHR